VTPSAYAARQLEEDRLVARAAAGDGSAFADLVRAHQGYLRKLLGRVCRGDQARADDLAQEAFVRAWRALPKFRGEARFRTWLTRLAYSYRPNGRRCPSRTKSLPNSARSASTATSPQGSTGVSTSTVPWLA
jgi:DNA-directed RNA polymerase specialized sigma24 family protein